MDKKSDFYERIIYKKNAVSCLRDILLEDFEGAKVLFLSSKQAYYKFGAFVQNELEGAKSDYKTKIIHSKFDKATIEKIVKQNKDCSLIVALGGGGICDIAKIVSKILGAKYVMIASNPSTTAYFSKNSFVSFDKVRRCFSCDYAHKILIDEMIISSATEEFVLSGMNLISSFWEMLFNFEFSRLMFKTDFDVNKLKLVLCKFKDNISYINSFSNDSKLVLMDILVDLACIIDGISGFETSIFSFAFLLEDLCAVKDCHFGTRCLIGQRILFETYTNFFLQKKLEVISMPDFDNLANNLRQEKISAKEVKLKEIKKAYASKRVFERLNMIKNQVFCYANISKSEINVLNVSKQIKVDVDKCFVGLNLLPFLYDCPPMLSIMASTGLMNF